MVSEIVVSIAYCKSLLNYYYFITWSLNRDFNSAIVVNKV